MNTTLNVAAPRAEARSLSEFCFLHKGGLTLAFAALIFIVSWLVRLFTNVKGPAEIAVSVAEAALIGGLCDYIALKMIFEEHWFLPGSGVLPRNRQKLIDGIANTIENEWLTPLMIGRKLNEMELVGQLGTFLEEVRIHDLLGQAGLERMLSRAIEYLESPEKLERLENVLRRTLPKTFTRIYSVMNRLGAESLSSRIAANLRRRLPQLRNDPELVATVEDAFHEFGHQLHDRNSYAHKLARNIIDTLVRRAVDASRGQISHMVREQLEHLSNEQLRHQIESKTRTHLDWIRVNGVIFGAVFGLMFAITQIVLHHGPALLARMGM
jgi:uncharacterized membrane-anchored protein YjiN (DUF445 family)